MVRQLCNESRRGDKKANGTTTNEESSSDQNEESEKAKFVDYENRNFFVTIENNDNNDQSNNSNESLLETIE